MNHSDFQITLLMSNIKVLTILFMFLSTIIVILHLSEQHVNKAVYRSWGKYGLLVTGVIGVFLHEFSHLIMAIIFGHRIVSFSFFSPNFANGTLGYVEHTQIKGSIWQTFGNFWIGIAPVLFGIGFLFALYQLFLPETELILPVDFFFADTFPSLRVIINFTVTSISKIALDIWHNKTVYLPIYLFLAISVSAHMAPSFADFKHAKAGALIFVIALLFICLVASYLKLKLIFVLAILPYAFLVLVLVSIFNIFRYLLVTITN